MSTVNGIPFNGGMVSPSGTGAQHIVETCTAICSWLIDGANPGQLLDSYPAGGPSIDWVARTLTRADNNPVLNWDALLLADMTGTVTLDWANHYLYDTSGNQVMDFSNGVGWFNASPVFQQTGGATTAGAVYTSNEQVMLNRMYSALRNYGLLS